jgi:ankyrin repeat protein
VARALIEADAELNMTDDVGRTPLFMAAQEGHEALVRALMEAGADFN